MTLLQLADRAPWRGQAMCATLADPDDMFPTPGDLDGQHAAKTVCGMCPARAACLAWALDTDQPYGVLGGLSEKERADLKGRRPPTDPDLNFDSAPRHNRGGGTPKPIDHGTYRGAKQHEYRGEDMCPDCRAAYNARHQEMQAARRAAKAVAA